MAEKEMIFRAMDTGRFRKLGGTVRQMLLRLYADSMYWNKDSLDLSM